MPREMVDPAFGPQLRHDGVDERVASSPFLPRRQQRRVVAPRNLPADRVVDHLVKVGHGVAVEVEELPPEQLAVERDWRLGVLAVAAAVHVGELVVEQPRRDAPKLEVRREHGRRRLEGVWRRLWFLERTHPRPLRHAGFESGEPRRFATRVEHLLRRRDRGVAELCQCRDCVLRVRVAVGFRRRGRKRRDCGVGGWDGGSLGKQLVELSVGGRGDATVQTQVLVEFVERVRVKLLDLDTSRCCSFHCGSIADLGVRFRVGFKHEVRGSPPGVELWQDCVGGASNCGVARHGAGRVVPSKGSEVSVCQSRIKNHPQGAPPTDRFCHTHTHANGHILPIANAVESRDVPHTTVPVPSGVRMCRCWPRSSGRSTRVKSESK
eukprot:m.57192 g.57192  ORF g.57192 m.57192 type:complete len:379 (-) comp17060_c0_seq1:253-1389(-)